MKSAVQKHDGLHDKSTSQFIHFYLVGIVSNFSVEEILASEIVLLSLELSHSPFCGAHNDIEGESAIALQRFESSATRIQSQIAMY